MKALMLIIALVFNANVLFCLFVLFSFSEGLEWKMEYFYKSRWWKGRKTHSYSSVSSYLAILQALRDECWCSVSCREAQLGSWESPYSTNRLQFPKLFQWKKRSHEFHLNAFKLPWHVTHWNVRSDFCFSLRLKLILQFSHQKSSRKLASRPYI